MQRNSNNSTNKRSKVKQTTGNRSSFMCEYKWWIIISLCLLIAGYFLIYVCFFGNGFFQPGTDLEKRDWLSFLGSYLSFAGTLIISLIAILQSRFFAEREKQRVAADRKKTIQPILSVSIVATNSQIAGTAEPFNPSDPGSIPQHKNVTIEIENVGAFPICNVIIFDKYLCQMLKPNEKKQLQVAYSDSPDAQRWKKHILELLASEFERTESGIPKWFNINYDDIDGKAMFQTYELKEFDGMNYYSLEGTHEV